MHASNISVKIVLVDEIVFFKIGYYTGDYTFIIENDDVI
jgi:hypothetical protein